MNFLKKYKFIFFLLLSLLPTAFNYFDWLNHKSYQLLLIYLIAIILVTVCLIYSLRSNNKYYTPLFFSIFILVSYLQRIYLVENNLDYWVFGGGYETVGNFDFGEKAYVTYFLVLIFGLTGLNVGFLFSNIKFRNTVDNSLNFKIIKDTFINKFIFYYFIFFLFIILFCSLFRIGVSGVKPVELPLHLTGFLVFLKNFIIHILGWYIFYTVAQNGNRKKVMLFLLLQFLLALLDTYFTMSKAMIIYYVLPYIIYLLLSNKKNIFKKKDIILIISTLCIAIPISFYGAQYLRFVNDDSIAKNIDIVDFFNNMFNNEKQSMIILFLNNIITNIATRVTGGSELMAVIGSNINNDFHTVWIILSGKAGTNSIIADKISEIYNIKLKEDNLLFSGKSIGFWGSLFLTKSYYLVFIGSFFYGYIIIKLEKLLYKNINQSLSVCCSFWLSYNVWESGFDLFVFMIPIILILFYFFKKSQNLKYFKSEFETIASQ